MDRVEDLVGHVLVHGGTGQKFRVVNVENGDPRIVEIGLESTAPRTISPRAINRTFHHTQGCGVCFVLTAIRENDGI